MRAAMVAMLVVAGSGAQAETLADALANAYKNSKLLESTRALLRARDEDVALAVSALRPIVGLSGNICGSLNNDPVCSQSKLRGSLQLTMNLLLFDFGATRRAIDSANEGVKAARQSLVEVEQAVLLNAVVAYHNVLRRKKSLALERNNLEVIQTELKAANDRFELGDITLTDVSFVKARLAAIRSSVAVSDGELAIAREQYKLATGNYPNDLAETPPLPELPETLEEALDIASRMHPSILRGRHGVAAAEYNIKRAESLVLPAISLGSALSASQDLETTTGPFATGDSATISLSASIPLYSGGRNSSGYRQVLALADQLRAEHRQTAMEVAQNVASAWTRLKIAESSIVASREQVESAQLAYVGVREEASLGLRTTLDVLAGEQQLLTARNVLVEARHNHDVAVYTVLSAIGLLTVEHLGLGVDRYDPDVYHNRVKTAPSTEERRLILDKILMRSGQKDG